MSARDTAPLRPQPGDLVTAEVESLPRIIRDIEAWFNDGSDNAAHPIDFICDLRDRLQGLVDYNAYRAGDAAGDPGPQPQEQVAREGHPVPAPKTDAEVIAAIRGELWEALRGREIGGDRTLVGMVKRLRELYEEAKTNRRGEFELRIEAEAKAAGDPGLREAWCMSCHHRWTLKPYESPFATYCGDCHRAALKAKAAGGGTAQPHHREE